MALDIYWTVLLLLVFTIILLTSRTFALRSIRRIQRRWLPRKSSSTHPRCYHDEEEKAEQLTALLTTSPETTTTPPPPTRDPFTGPPRLPPIDNNTRNDVASFRLTFLTIYLLVMTPETLAAPYLWSLLREEKALPEATIAALFATAYTSAAVSALGVGFLADRYGRKKACLVQCGFHVAACLTVIFGGRCLPVLFLGRVFAGVGLTLLWTVFEVSF